jgi:hypothetical protein
MKPHLLPRCAPGRRVEQRGWHPCRLIHVYINITCEDGNFIKFLPEKLKAFNSQEMMSILRNRWVHYHIRTNPNSYVLLKSILILSSYQRLCHPCDIYSSSLRHFYINFSPYACKLEVHISQKMKCFICKHNLQCVFYANPLQFI